MAIAVVSTKMLASQIVILISCLFELSHIVRNIATAVHCIELLAEIGRMFGSKPSKFSIINLLMSCTEAGVVFCIVWLPVSKLMMLCFPIYCAVAVIKVLMGCIWGGLAVDQAFILRLVEFSKIRLM